MNIASKELVDAAPVGPSGPAVPFVATLVEREKEMIETALAYCQGRVAGLSGAAAKLGILRQTLVKNQNPGN